MTDGGESNIRFRALLRGDLPMLHEWLQRPHVAKWWGAGSSIPELEAEYGPLIDDAESPHRVYIATVDDRDIGFIQSYVPALTHDDGWWLDEHDPGVRGTDQFLADGGMLGRGVGTAMLRAFAAKLFEDASVWRIQTDPDPNNARAIRSYEKAGFRFVRQVETKDGAALLMYCDRAGFNGDAS